MLALIAALDTRNYLRVRGEYVDRDRGSMRRGNYLRVRGEYTTWREDLSAGLELPPRARRIPPRSDGRYPACWNYLRVRGEYCSPVVDDTLTMELPPRARRILPSLGKLFIGAGTTSACAENTHQYGCLVGHAMNYLRVRGEYTMMRLFF